MLDPTISTLAIPYKATSRLAAALLKLRLLALVLMVAASFFFLCSAARAETVVRSVGTGPNCDFDDLETAVDVLLDLPADERLLKIERGLVEGVSLQAFGASLTIRGGFESCDDATPAPGATTLLFGTGAAPVLEVGTIVPLVTKASTTSAFRIENLELQGGRHGLQIRGPADVLLSDSLILNNEAPRGGGISVLAASRPVTLDLVRTGVNGNRTLSSASVRPDGAGLHCIGAEESIRALEGTIFVGNFAADDGYGGGLFLEGCTFEAEGNVKIQLNRAHRGGGIAAADAQVTLRGDAEDSIQVALNRAEERLSLAGRGGGIYLENGSDLDALGVRFEDNRALPEIGEEGGSGGGLFVTSSTARLDRPEAGCLSLCSILGRNRAAFGAAAGVDLVQLPESAALTASCVVVHDATTLRNAFDVLEADPQFVDRPGGDLHIESTSPAVDLCPSTLGTTVDIDGQSMPVDQLTVPDEGTPADAGADEVPFIEPPEPDVFSDSFESGDLSAWSQVVG